MGDGDRAGGDRGRATSGTGLQRIDLGGEEERLFFAQVREDPTVEIEALGPGPGDVAVVVSSGGCTALSLLAAGAGRVVAVDLNATQNHLVELKAVAVSRLGTGEALVFLGGASRGGASRGGASRGGRAAAAARRSSAYARIRADLSPAARAYWDRRRRAVAAGVLGAGVSERFIRVVARAIRLGVHPEDRIRRLLACRSLDEQRALYQREWDNRRWRLLFEVLLNRAVFRHTYDPAFFRHVENPSFARHFFRLAEHALTEVPVADNYFVHHMLTGSYPHGVPGGVPPYLDPAAAETMARAPARLTLVDGSYVDYLRTRPDGSVSCFALSNICEWLEPAQVDDLLAEVVRTATPGARLVFRNFVGWTEVPARWRDAVVEDRALGERLIRRDRSAVQRRVAVCRIHKAVR